VLLLDTCTFLWAATGDACVPALVQARLRDPNQQVLLSAASVWEMCLKFALGKLPLPEAPERYIPGRRARLGFTALPIDESDVFPLARLPALHRDPFDRMLVSQAINRGFTIVTPDAAVRAYPCLSWWG
jgi:PIN domain nuclease of toxin-antitoxin system